MLVDPIYTELLELEVEKEDKDKLRKAEQQRTQREYVPPEYKRVAKETGKQKKTKKKGASLDLVYCF